MAILLNTANLNDALACGYPYSAEAAVGGLRVEYEHSSGFGPAVTLYGIEGEVELTTDVEIEEVIKCLQRALALSKREEQTK